MFAKAFRVKSNTAMKGSDRRKLRADILAAFPSLSADDLSELIPNKDELNVVKIYTHKGDAVTLYILHKNPVCFQLDKHIYPTVYTLWKYPDMLPAFVTWPAVLQKLVGGADLMLPGVVVPPSGLPEVARGDCCAVTLVSNRAPVAVGTVTMSSEDMMSSGMKGKGVNILHTYMDHLWSSGDKSVPPPLPATVDKELMEGEGGEGVEVGGEDDEVGEERQKQNGETGSCSGPEGDPACPGLQEPILEESENEEERQETGKEEREEEEQDSKSPQEQMDALLLQCFLHALKTRVKKSELPLLTSTFLRNHMVSCCPSGKQLDIKKSSYKKLSKFLQCMQKEHSLVQVKELSKGVESIVNVDWKNPELRSFTAPEDCGMVETPAEVGGPCEAPYQPPEITALYGVTAKLEPIFLDAKKKKGAVLPAPEVRTIITEYVKNNDLVDEHNKNFICVNPILCDCLLEKSEYQEVEKLKWDDLFSRTLCKMQPHHQLQYPGHPAVVKKGQVDPIDISVSSRGSNKKVTIIKNLEVFGLDPAAVAAALQHRVQASTVLHDVPGSKDRVLVQVQGNQIQQVGKLLLDEYHLPRKYIQGLEKAQKPGKKK
ncbi:eukaryotic translation initiation factor 2D isoform X2 [Denticeps clupeoides]|uniref:Eukaryotic translation initiation factor 2D n=1 Tax=Denticeps clupeoides TaxID=299321 RepID=A0AAY4CZV7_9TELE|nr:eukaryotic translation initiation factor 2D isoform X2 [Denticeps clupeoides]